MMDMAPSTPSHFLVGHRGPWTLLTPKLDTFDWGTPDIPNPLPSPQDHHDYGPHLTDGESEAERSEDLAQPISF